MLLTNNSDTLSLLSILISSSQPTNKQVLARLLPLTIKFLPFDETPFDNEIININQIMVNLKTGRN